MKKVLSLLLCLSLGACAAIPADEATPTAPAPYRITPDENPFAPQLQDTGRQVAGVTITSVLLTERFEFSPLRAEIHISGYMPSVCNELRVEIKAPDADFRLFIEVYSLLVPGAECDDVFQGFDTSILLGRYSPGRYTVWVNGSPAGDFVSY